MIHRLKYLRSTTKRLRHWDFKDIGIRKSEVVANTQFLFTFIIFVGVCFYDKHKKLFQYKDCVIIDHNVVKLKFSLS